MKHTIKKIITFLLVGILSSGIAFAQAPQKFNYQGIARDAKGNPISKQQMSLKLSVLPTSDATEAEYEETQLVTTNEFGLYTLQIGNGTALTGDMKTVKWETGNKYIKVAIDPKGGTDYVDMGTSQLLSVPYAIYADKAGTAANGGTTKGTRASTPNYIEMTNSSGTTDDASIIYQKETTGGTETWPNSIVSGLFKQIGIGTTTPLSSGYVHLKGPTINGNPRQPLIIESERGVHNLIMENGLLRGYFGSYVGSGTFTAPGFTAINFPSPLGTQNEDFDVGTSNSNPTGKLHLTTRTTPRITVLPTSQVGVNTTTPSLTTQLDVNGSGSPSLTLGGLGTPGMATGIHATAMISTSLAQTNRASIGGYTESIAILGEGKAANTTASTLNIGTAGTANTINRFNVGVLGEAKSAIKDNIGVLGAGNGNSTSGVTAGIYGEINTVGTSGVNYGVGGKAPLALNSWAGHFTGKVTVTNGAPNKDFTMTNTTNGVEFNINNKKAGQIDEEATTRNTLIGSESNLNLTTGVDNTGLGHSALKMNSTGSNNTAIGISSLENNTNGLQNTAVGSEASRSNTSGTNNAALGWHSLFSNTTGAENTALGSDVMPWNTASENTGVGFQSLGSNTTGTKNVALGWHSLFSNTTSNENTAVGWSALSLSTSKWNTGLGAGALQFTTIGEANTATGIASLRNNTTGGYNTASGVFAATGNTTGNANTAFGANALQQNTAGNNNVAVGGGTLAQNQASDNAALGTNALSLNVTGTRNTAMGTNTLQNSLTDDNTAIGYNALNISTSGNENTAVGSNALASNSSGYANIAVGFNALASNTSAGNNTAIGNAAAVNNTTGTENTTIGINTFVGNSTGSYNTTLGSGSLLINNGDNNTAIGQGAMSNGLTGSTHSFCTALGSNTTFTNPSNSMQYSTAIGANANVTQNNSIILGRSGGTSVQDKVGINTPAPHSALQVNGSFATAVQTVSSSISVTTPDDYTFHCTAGVTVNLPAANTCHGRIYVFTRNSPTIFPWISVSTSLIDSPVGFGVVAGATNTWGSSLVSITYQADGPSNTWKKIATAQ